MRVDISPTRMEGAQVPFVWAHRGASALAPENSLEAFLLADELGADGVELDVRLTRDGVPVVVHDRSLWLDGTTLYCRPDLHQLSSSRRLSVAACTWGELEKTPVAHRDGSSAAIVRLESVFEALPSRLWVDVEVKAGRDYDSRIADVVHRCILRRPERVLASSFDHVVLRELANSDPSLPLLAICHARLVDPALSLSRIPATMICVDRPFLGRADVERWRGDGLEVSVGALEPDDLREVLGWPLSGVFVDDPRLVGEAAKKPSQPR